MSKIVDFASQQLGVKLFDGQSSVLADYYASRKPHWLLLAGRRSGKSLLSDVVATYEATIPDYAGILRPDEDRYVIIVSTRLDNASLHIRNIQNLLRHKRELGNLIKTVKQDRIELTNGVTILSLPASARAGRGYTASTIVLDELAHFIDSQGNQSADAVFDAFSPTVATFGELGRIVITTTPAARTGIVFDLYDRSQQGELEDFFISHKTTREMNPRVSQKTIDRAMNRDSLSASTEYLAEFSDPVASFFDGDAIDAAITARRGIDKGDPSKQYAMAIDPATMGDRYAFVIMHREGDKHILDYAHILMPPVNPNAAEDLLISLVQRFNPYTVLCDTASTHQRLKDIIPAMTYAPFSRQMKLRIYGALKESMNAGQLVLYKHNDLIDELRALQIRNGVDIAAPRSGRVTHDDLTDCLALCVDQLVSAPSTGWDLVPDPFGDDHDWPPKEGEYFQPGRGWRMQNPYHYHSKGATGPENCAHRTAGCDECEEALAPLIREQEEAAAKLGQTMTQQEYEDWRLKLRNPWTPPPTQEEIAADKLWQMIVRDVKNKTKG